MICVHCSAAGVGWGQGVQGALASLQFLADQLILSQPGWHILSTKLLCVLPDFQNFLRPCTVYSVHSSNNTDHYSIAHRNLEMYVQPPYVIDGSYADPYIRLNTVTSQCFSLIIYPELHIGNFYYNILNIFSCFQTISLKIQIFLRGIYLIGDLLQIEYVRDFDAFQRQYP